MIRRVLLALSLLLTPLGPLHETAEAQQSAAARRCAIYLCGGNRPALDLNLAATGAFPSSVTFTRASTATYTNSAGLLTTASSGVPRFVYDPNTLVPLGYLSEAAATNIQLHSQFDSGWGATNGAVVASNATSPDGSLDAATFTENTATGLRELFLVASTVITANTVYTASAFVKAGTGSTVALRWEISGRASGLSANIDLNAGTISPAITYGTGTSAAAPAIQAFGNGWYRVFLAGTVDAASTGAFLVIGAQNPLGTDIYTGTNRTFFAFGADIKSGLDYSSYIPTTTASATRAADFASATLALIGVPATPSALAIVGKFISPIGFDTAKSYNPVRIDDGSAVNSVDFRFNAAANSPFIAQNIRSSASQIILQAIAAPAASTVTKFWAAFAPRNSALQAVGQTKQTNAAAATPLPIGLTTVRIGSGLGGAQLSAALARLQIYTSRLSDAQAAAIAAGL